MKPVTKNYFAWDTESACFLPARGAAIKVDGLDIDLFIYLHPFFTGQGGFWRICDSITGMEIYVPNKGRSHDRKESIANLERYVSENPGFAEKTVKTVERRRNLGTISPRYGTSVLLQY